MDDTCIVALAANVLLQHFAKFLVVAATGICLPATIGKMAVDEYTPVICNKYHDLTVIIYLAVFVAALYLEYFCCIGVAVRPG